MPISNPATSVGGGGPHHASHELLGTDKVSVAGLSGLLADAQTPLAHTHAEADVIGLVADLAALAAAAAATPAHHLSHENGGVDELNLAGLNGVLADPQPPIIGATAVTAVAGNDARLTDARTPTAHKVSHQDGGTDEISVLGLSGLLADQQTPLAHDILTKHNGFPGGTATFLRADGSFAGVTATPPVLVGPQNLVSTVEAIAANTYVHVGRQLEIAATGSIEIPATATLEISP